MNTRALFACTAILIFLAIGCAHQGPLVPKPPTVRFTHFNSIAITPQVIKFQVKLAIRNQMPVNLNIQRVDYAVDLNGKELFTSSFDQLKRMKGKGRQVVTFPFQIAMKDIVGQAVDILAGESIKVSFRGFVYPGGNFGFASIPFKMTQTIPMPRVPEITLARTEGTPFEKIFKVFLKIKNKNTFPLTIKAIDSYLEINQKKYSLLKTREVTKIEPKTTGTLELQMHNTTGKTLSMILNVVQSPSPKFNVGGTIKCGTPYGLIYVPLKLIGESK